ncbi:S-adenosyl-L-methionine-dependent methyltransferase [Leucogyrophana mollusca]|uniref:S-adenosyl-L-methionine-dependent methyltransferase n=1 Tax=Leucogyrophana mollusca TaxID=85980 RepID=A0ACB8B1A0_9AGAM|nr:S-adenosyl-L-methionine-dependent methyltransferase [Leucogyrophana mollusca]
MGKKSNFSGLSRFVQEAFGDGSKNEGPPTSATPNKPITHPLIDVDERRPAKKRKIELLGAGWETYDASGLVPHYKEPKEVPDHLQKYFSQRKRYFSLYDEGCLLDEEGWYSVTPERIANQIAERCRCDTILDAFCGVGGNAIAFAKTCERVIALDTSPVRLALARHNAVIYGVADRIEFILADYISFAQAHLSRSKNVRTIDVVFLSPPWGGPSYLSSLPEQPIGQEATSGDVTPIDGGSHPEYSLSNIKPIHGAQLFQLSRDITCNIAYFLPRNTKLEEISALLAHPAKSENASDVNPSQMVEVEEEWMGSKLKALTCYFGGLVNGQEHLF